MTETMTIEEVAKILRVEPRTVRVFCRRDGLRFSKLGKKTLRFKAEWVNDFLERKSRDR